MNIMKCATVALALISAAGFASANEVLLTKSMSKKGNSIALDIVSDGTASAFNFEIPLNDNRRVNPKTIDLSGCLSELPASHVGGCAYRAKKNDIAVIVYSTSNALLPKGIVGLGTITVPSGFVETANAKGVVFASPEGKAAPGKGSIEK